MASRRHYVTIEEVQELADIKSIDDTEFEDRITQCEELVDIYVGPQDRHVCQTFRGYVTSASGRTIIDTSNTSQLFQYDNYFANCEIEIIGGTGIGQHRFIASSTRTDRSITVDSDWTTEPDTTSFFRIYQLAKFPRQKDVFQNNAGTTYYKTIPDAVRRAVAAQMQFMIAKGDDFFADDNMEMQSESIGNYSYSRGGNGQSATVKMIAPRARALLRGIVNRTGRIVSGPASTWQ